VEHGLELLKQGVIWRNWNGSNIQVWRDNWISRDGGLKITGRRKFTRIKWVKSLLGNGHNGWNVRLVQEIFLNQYTKPNYIYQDCMALWERWKF
jgi:hypothetical protein